MQTTHLLSVVIAATALLVQHAYADLPQQQEIQAAALAAQRDSDPRINGVHSEAQHEASDTVMQKAAEASRRDQDPRLNGALTSAPALAAK